MSVSEILEDIFQCDFWNFILIFFPIPPFPNHTMVDPDPQNRLLTVRATYRPPQVGAAHNKHDAPKLCGTVQTLTYGSRDAYVRGLDEGMKKDD